MESLSELISGAQAIGKAQSDNSLGGQLSSILQGAFSGYEAGKQRAKLEKSEALDRAVKLMDLQKKTADLNAEATNNQITSNMAKRMGLLDTNPHENTSVRSTAFDGLGGGAPAPTDHTATGKLSAVYQAAVGGTPYNVIKPKFSSKEGFGFDFERDPSIAPKAPKDPVADQKRIYDLAAESARREKYATMSSILPPDQMPPFSAVQTTDDEVQKLIPESTAFLKGDTATQKQLAAQRKASGVNDFNTLKAIQNQIQNSGRIHSIANGIGLGTPDAIPGVDPDTLKDYRTTLLNGGSMNDILNKIDSQARATKDFKEKARLLKMRTSVMKLGGQ